MRHLVLSFALIAACSKPQAPAPASAKAPRADLQTIASERGNLLNMAAGGAVVSRTGELTLDSSAVAAIDGEDTTGWGSPPSDIDQTVVYALPAPARIESVGILTPRADSLRINNLRLESSADGKTFAPLAEPALTSSAESQTFPVTPVDAQYIRFTLTGAAGTYPSLQSLQVRGRFLVPPRPSPIGGCWTVNGEPSSFDEKNGVVTGRIGTEVPFYMVGGAEGTVYRFAWVNGPDHGLAAITVVPGSQAMSGLRWYERAHAAHTGGGWFGEKRACDAAWTATPADFGATFLQRGDRYPLFTLRFDESDQLPAIDEISWSAISNALTKHPSQKIRLVSREYRSASGEINARRAKARIDALRAALTARRADLSRIEFVAAGSEPELASPTGELIRLMHSVVEISLQ